MAGLIYDLETLDIKDIKRLFGCSHDRAHELFEATLREQNCPFVSFSCRDHAEYESGECQRLDKATIGRMGMDSVRFNLSGSYYLETTDDKGAFCMHYLEVLIQLGDDQEEIHGNIIFVIESGGATSDLLPGWSSGTVMTPGVEIRTTLHSPVDPSDLASLHLTWHAQGSGGPRVLRPARLRVRRVDAELRVTTDELCGDAAEVSDKETVAFRPCAPAGH
ncbi:endothelial lipase-like [Pollicipes pollicipes]|uniref:endothelial lipase-like n=1 Tax=Pollicipes pollicipes TaxID=41117 RepID=UPI001884CD71|nr:endothelial lipase-like [Pollicipes pollicipes]